MTARDDAKARMTDALPENTAHGGTVHVWTKRRDLRDLVDIYIVRYYRSALPVDDSYPADSPMRKTGRQYLDARGAWVDFAPFEDIQPAVSVEAGRVWGEHDAVRSDIEALITAALPTSVVLDR